MVIRKELIITERLSSLVSFDRIVFSRILMSNLKNVLIEKFYTIENKEDNLKKTNSQRYYNFSTNNVQTFFQTFSVDYLLSWQLENRFK